MKTKMMLVGLVVAMLGIGGLSLYMALHKESSTAQALPKDTQAVVTIKKNKVTVQDRNVIKEIVIPKFGTLAIRVTDKGQVVLESSNRLPRLGVRPHVGVAYTGRIEPVLGIQVLRIEPMQLGASLCVTPSLIGLSIDKDLTDNAIVGLGTGISSEDMQQRFFVFLSLSF